MKLSLPIQALTIAAIGLALAGCETTGNPREGGIFWSETKAQQRLAVRRSELHEAQGEEATARARTSQLEARRETMQATVARQRRALAQLGSEISAMQRSLRGEPGATESLEAELQRLQQQRAALATHDSLSAPEKERELQDLRAEVDRLKERSKLLKETR